MSSKIRLTKTAFVFILIIFSIFLSSCTGTRSTQGGTNENYRVGSEGLRMEIAQGFPPTKIYDDEDLNVLIELYNRGATDLEGGNNRIYLSGFDTSIVTGISSDGEYIENLEGKSVYNDEGGYTTIGFDGYVRDLSIRHVDKYNINLLVTACYFYETIASPNVCIDPDPYSRSYEDKVCNHETVIMTGTQGAPIAVSDVDTEAMPEKTRFKIFVSNVGSGTVFKEDYTALDKCNPYHTVGLERTDVDFVKVEEVKIGDTSIINSCKPLENGYLRLKDNSRGYMVCDYEGLTGPAYNTPLRVKLSYGYRSTLSRNIEILQSDI